MLHIPDCVTIASVLTGSLSADTSLWCQQLVAAPTGIAAKNIPGLLSTSQNHSESACITVCDLVLQEKNRFTKEGVLVMTSTRHRTQRCVDTGLHACVWAILPWKWAHGIVMTLHAVSS